jgi:hypothetical protein
MPKIYPCSVFSCHSTEIFHANLAKLKSNRKVVPVVTRTGALVRGVFPSIKTIGFTRFQSKNERNTLRVLEVSSAVKQIVTHPAVLDLSDKKALFYTPDAIVEFHASAVLLEAKARYFLQEEKTRDRLVKVTSRLNSNQIGLLYFLNDDIAPDLAKEIEDLLYLRPAVGRKRLGIDINAWDPLQRSPHKEALEQRWKVAQTECNTLIARLMRRDPGELLYV